MKSAKAYEEHRKEAADAWDTVMGNIDKLTGSQKELALTYKKAGRSLVDGSVGGAITHEVGHHVAWQALDAATNNAVGGRMKEFAPKISGYANASKGEYLAESFSAYAKGEREKLDPKLVEALDEKFVGGGGRNAPALSDSAAGSVQLGSSLEGYTDEQKAEIAHLLDKAPQEIRDAFAKYGSQFQEVDSYVDPSIGEAYFEPMDGHVHMNRRDTATGNVWKAKYQTHFHEFAHNIDYLAGSGNFASQAWRSKGGEALEDIIEKDWEAALKNYFMSDAKNGYMHKLDMQFDSGGQGGEVFLRNMLANWRQINRLSRHDSSYLDLKNELDALDGTIESYRVFWQNHFDTFKDMVYNNFTDKKDVLDSLMKDMDSSLREIEKGDLSDMLERYAINAGGSAYERPLQIGHGEQYALTEGNLSIEAFAEMTSASITNSESLAQIKKYLPNAYDAYLEMIRGMI